jgi:hypothetical protein
VALLTAELSRSFDVFGGIEVEWNGALWYVTGNDLIAVPGEHWTCTGIALQRQELGE